MCAPTKSFFVDAVKADGGRVLELVAADDLLATFERPRDALSAAPKIRERLRTEAWFPNDERPLARTAIHSGVVADPSARHLGSVALHCGVLCGAAEPGQILVSHATEALLEGDAPDVRLRDLGERVLESDGRPCACSSFRADLIDNGFFAATLWIAPALVRFVVVR